MRLLSASLLLMSACARSAAEDAPPQDDGHDPVVATDDADGDGYPTEVDCDDADPSIHPDAVEACEDGLDDDCDGHVDGGDGDCPLAGVVHTSDADVALDPPVGGLRDGPRRYPADGADAMVIDDGESVTWYALGAALRDEWTPLGSVPTAGGGEAETGSDDLELPDADGDGQLDLLVFTAMAPGMARFAELPVTLTADAATMAAPAIYAIGLGADLDGDGFSDIVGCEDGYHPPVVYWYGAAQTGVVGTADALASLEVAADVPEQDEWLYRGVTTFAFDAEGDGVDETAVVLSATRGEGNYEWAHLGWAWLVPAGADGGTLDAAADVVLHDELAPLHDVAALGDLDDDGYDDLVAGWDGGLAILGGPFDADLAADAAVARVDGLVNVWDPHRGDMDGDGGIDILVTGMATYTDENPDLYVVSDPADGGALDAARLVVDFTSYTDCYWPLYFWDANEDGRDDLAGRFVFLSR